MRIKRILSSIYHSAADRSAPEWPEWALRYSARTPASIAVLSDWQQRTKQLSPLTPATAAIALNATKRAQICLGTVRRGAEDVTTRAMRLGRAAQ